MAEPPSSPPSDNLTVEETLSWYKSQYEQLGQELAEFRESSSELERELEKDIDEAEKRERVLQEKAETLSFEVEEWKRKYRESKAEANAAQNTLEREITTLRESNRGMQMKLRDIEVANDDFERQARKTTSSLEDLESKYNMAVERAVLLDDEIKMGEQERESLRIETQRLKEELSEVKIEAELLQDKVQKLESRHLSTISTNPSMYDSPMFDKNDDASPDSTASSPLITTPPDTKLSHSPLVPAMHDPPSPPMSDASAPAPPKLKAPSISKTPVSSTSPRKPRMPDSTPSLKPRPKNFSSSLSKPPGVRVVTATATTRTPANRSTAPRSTSNRLPASNSLSHIRSLTAQVQRLEARVQSARSKLPAPVHTPPRASPHASINGMTSLPSTVTIRPRKRTMGSTASSSTHADDTTPTNREPAHRATTSKHVPRLSTSGVSRLSFGPLPNRNPGGVSAADSDASISRPSSRASISSYVRPGSRTEMNPPPRPISRASLSGARTPLTRPRSSLGGSMHGHSASISRVEADMDEDADFRTPSRRGTYSKLEIDSALSGIPAPASSIPMPSRRQSGGASVTGRRVSSGLRAPTPVSQTLDELDETY